MHLLTQVAEEHGSEETSDCQLDVIDMVFGDGPELNPVELKLLAEPCDILWIAADAIQGFRHDNVDLSIADVTQQAAQARRSRR
jgi:hypothetical protein